jgi:hypothetical protein
MPINCSFFENVREMVKNLKTSSKQVKKSMKRLGLSNLTVQALYEKLKT